MYHLVSRGLSALPCPESINGVKIVSMSNLLSQEQQKKVYQEYVSRRGSVLLVFGCFSLCALFIFLLPSYVISYFKEQELQLAVKEFTRSDLLSNEHTLEHTLQAVNEKLDMVSVSNATSSISAVVTTIVTDRVPGIIINKISYQQATPATIVVGGVSHGRENLTAFIKNLSKEGLFSSVTVPISDFAKDINIVFSIQITTKN